MHSWRQGDGTRTLPSGLEKALCYDQAETNHGRVQHQRRSAAWLEVQNDRWIKNTGLPYPYMHYWYSWVPHFSPFRSTASRFWVIRHFENTAPNDPKIPVNATSSNVPHIRVTSAPCPKCQLFFSYRPFWEKYTDSTAAYFRVTGPFELQHRMTQNDHEPNKVKCTHICY